MLHFQLQLSALDTVRQKMVRNNLENISTVHRPHYSHHS